MLNRSSPTYTHLGAVPELKYVLLRNNDTNQIEAWTYSRGLSSQAVIIGGYELEYVRPIKHAFRVLDTEYNRTHQFDDIGRIYIDDTPTWVETQELK